MDRRKGGRERGREEGRTTWSDKMERHKQQLRGGMKNTERPWTSRRGHSGTVREKDRERESTNLALLIQSRVYPKLEIINQRIRMLACWHVSVNFSLK